MPTTYSVYLKAPSETSEQLAERLYRLGALLPEADGSLGYSDDFDHFQFTAPWTAEAEIRNHRLFPEDSYDDTEYGFERDIRILFYVSKSVESLWVREDIVEMARGLSKDFEVIVTYADDEVALYQNNAPRTPLVRHPDYAGPVNEWERLPDGKYLGTLYAIYANAPGMDSADVSERLIPLGAESYERDDENDVRHDKSHVKWSWMPKSEVWDLKPWPLFFDEPGHGDGYQFRIGLHVLQSDDTQETRERVVAIAEGLAREFQTLVVYDDGEVALYENDGAGTPLVKTDEYRGLRSEWLYDPEGRYIGSSGSS